MLIKINEDTRVIVYCEENYKIECFMRKANM